MPKLHLKNLLTDHLALCNIWPNTNWVLKELAPQQEAGKVCKICGIVAAKLAAESPPKALSAKA